MSALNAKHLHDEAAAYAFVEAHLWADGRPCPHCGVVDQSGALKGASTRLGVYKCYACRKPFTVKVGTIFEASHIKLHIWLQAMFLLSSSKKGISSNQLARTLDITLKSAWFLSHRIREAMKDGSIGNLGGEGMVVEADETYQGKKKVDLRGGISSKGTPFTKSGKAGMKRAIVSLVERGGQVRSFHVDRADKATVAQIVMANVAKETRLHTDESKLYKGADGVFASHETVMHKDKEYARGDVNTNSVEGYFSIFKRGMKGIYQHCDEKHLHRYLNEYDFRYNNRVALGVNDDARAVRALKGVVGKRLTHRTIGSSNAGQEAQG